MGKTTPTPLLTSLLLLLPPPLAFLCCLSYGVAPPLLPVLLLILSSVFLRRFAKKKLGYDQNLGRDHSPPFYFLTETQSSDGDDGRTGQKDESAVESSPGFSSENETAENLGSWDSSSDSDEEDDDDDDSLIEISLPDRELKRFSSEKQPQQIFPELYPDFPGSQTGLMELIADLNDMIYEEDNFIEIDISMGSIKCPACKIES